MEKEAKRLGEAVSRVVEETAYSEWSAVVVIGGGLCIYLLLVDMPSKKGKILSLVRCGA